ncbi:MAG TPA: TcpE family conjugal transfer membrane protein [Euzebyales bacterium]|nr:TcpE family conjugal transfer membrane protein [Euzebyales bacterium]
MSDAQELPEDAIVCQTYTHARRYPLVVGKIGGYHLPVPWTPAQLVTAAATFALLLWARDIWAHLGTAGNFLVACGLPLLLAWAIRHLRIEGRSTVRALAGFGRFLSRSPRGRLHGRPVVKPRARRRPAVRIFVTQTVPAAPAGEHRPWHGTASTHPISAQPQGR